MDVDELVNDISNNVAQDNGVDYIKMTEGIDTINRFASIALGMITVLISILMPIVIALEILYINWPPVRSGVDKALVNGPGKVQSTIKFFLRDGIKAVTEANTIETGKSANALYIGIKTKWIIITVICIAIALCGASTIIGFIVRMLKGVIDVIVKAIN